MSEVYMVRFNSVILVLTLSLLFFSCDDDDTENPVISTDPSVVITAPGNNASVSDYVKITADAFDNVGIARVDFYVDASRAYIDPATPYEMIWDTYGLKHGTNHSVYAVAYDTDQNSTGSATITVTIDTSLGTPEPPILSIDSSNVTISSIPVRWSMFQEDDFFIYKLIYDTTDQHEPSLHTINITSVTDTTRIIDNLMDNTLYFIQVEVSDVFGKKTASNIESVYTLNAPPPVPVISLVSNGLGYKSINWNKVTMNDFLSYEIITSVDSVFDLTDNVIATITNQNTTSYDYYTNDTTNYYYFLVVKDNTNEYSVSAPYYNTPQINYALDFNGSKYATIPYFDGLNLGDTYTLEAWVYQRDANTFDRVIDKSPPGSPYLQYSLISGTKLGTDVCADGNPGRYLADTGVTLFEWHHIALSYDFGFITYYIDGQVVDTMSTGISSSCEYTTTLNIGRRKLFDEFYFDGSIDEVRVWNITRSPAEIMGNYNINLAGTESGLVCYYQFNEGVGDIITSLQGENGYLGNTESADIFDPVWVESGAPIQ
ncbi:MAG: hypothetical protein DWP97_07785 [Calditrichaeota bacterium]|nr:MAG: hypothetical protein DWP97_07785 [Calditrichota bacterium]